MHNVILIKAIKTTKNNSDRETIHLLVCLCVTESLWRALKGDIVSRLLCTGQKLLKTFIENFSNCSAFRRDQALQ